MTRLVGLLVLGALLAAGPADATFPGDNSVIVFASARGDSGIAIHAMAPDGTNVRAFTHHPPFASGPAWSPDGGQIAFAAGLGSDLPRGAATRELWVVRPDGSGLQPLVRELNDTSEASSHLVWSPDGRRIAYLDSPATPFARDDVWVVDADGSNRRRVTRTAAGEQGPVWSPEGGRLAYSIYTDAARADLWIVDADGSRPKRLTRTRDDDRAPSWSPNGRMIAFTRFRAGPGLAIWVVRSDGTRPRRLTSGRDPRWSPRGASIAFVRGSRAYAMRADGSGIRALGPGSDPVWSPDGSRLALLTTRRVFDRRGNPRLVRDLHLVRADGTSRRRVFTGPDGTGAASWSPDGRRLVLAAAPSFHRGELLIVRADGTGAAPLLHERPAMDYAPTVSADGRRVAFTRKLLEFDCSLCLPRELHVAALDGSAPTSLERPSEEQSWSPDGTRLAVADVDLEVVSLADGRSSTLVRRIETTFRGQTMITRIGGPAWSPDGSRLAYLVGGSYGELMLLTFGSDSRPLGRSGGNLAWSPDGKTLAYTSEVADGVTGVFALEVETGTSRLLVRDAFDGAWSPDGRRLAFARTLGRNTEIFVANADGSDPLRITFNPGPDLAPDWQRLPGR